MANYTTDTTLTSNLANGEDLTIGGVNVTLTIDASVFIPTMTYGNIVSTGTGTFLFKNKTNNILPITFSDENKNFRVENVSTLKLDGDLIEIATGDGTAGQTIDFSSIGNNGVSIDFPNAVWIEETPGGATRPFINLGDPTDASSPTLTGDGIGKENYGGVGASLETGMYFQYDRSTQVATFGDGTNGHVIPNGCKVFFPNIVVDSTWVDNLSTRSTFDTSSNGSLDIFGVQISEAIYVTAINAQTLKFEKTSFSDYISFKDMHKQLYFKNIAFRGASRGSRSISYSNWVISDLQTDNVTFEDIYLADWTDIATASTSNRTQCNFQFNTGGDLKNIHLHLVDKRNTGHNAKYTIGILSVDNGTITDLYSTTMVNFSTTSNSTIKNVYYGATVFNPVAGADHGAKYRGQGYAIAGTNTKIINWSLIADTLAPVFIGRATGIIAQKIEIYNHNYTYTKTYSNGGEESAFEILSDNCIIKNCVIDSTTHTRSIEHNVDSVNLTAENVIFKNNELLQARKGVTYNMVSQRFNSSAVQSPAQDIGIYLAHRSDSLVDNEGHIVISFAPPLNNSYHYVLGPNSYWDNSTRIYIAENESVEIGGKQPMRGFTGFRDDIYYEIGGLEYPEMDVAVEMVNGDEEFTGTYTAIDTSTANWYSGLNTIFNSLTGYDSDIGLNIRFKITRNQVGTGNVIDVISLNIPCFIDSNFVSKEGSITFEGGDATEKYEILKDSDDSVLYTFIGTGAHDFFVGSNLDEDVYFKRYKYVDNVYVLLVTTKYTTQKLILGDNGKVLLYTGGEVQVASTDVESIWSYDTRTTTEGFTSSDRTQLNKGLTTGKFLALK